MSSEELKDKLVMAATTYDRRQAKRPGYNRYALGQYLQRIDEVVADVAAGAELGKALGAGFCGPLLRVLSRAVGVEATEKRGAWFYQPEANR